MINDKRQGYDYNLEYQENFIQLTSRLERNNFQLPKKLKLNDNNQEILAEKERLAQIQDKENLILQGQQLENEKFQQQQIHIQLNQQIQQAQLLIQQYEKRNQQTNQQILLERQNIQKIQNQQKLEEEEEKQKKKKEEELKKKKEEEQKQQQQNQPVVQPATQSVNSISQPVIQPAVQPAAQPVSQNSAQPVVQPVAKPAVQPVVQPIVQSSVQSVYQKANPFQSSIEIYQQFYKKYGERNAREIQNYTKIDLVSQVNNLKWVIQENSQDHQNSTIQQLKNVSNNLENYGKFVYEELFVKIKKIISDQLSNKAGTSCYTKELPFTFMGYYKDEEKKEKGILKYQITFLYYNQLSIYIKLLKLNGYPLLYQLVLGFLSEQISEILLKNEWNKDNYEEGINLFDKPTSVRDKKWLLTFELRFYFFMCLINEEFDHIIKTSANNYGKKNNQNISQGQKDLEMFQNQFGQKNPKYFKANRNQDQNCEYCKIHQQRNDKIQMKTTGKIFCISCNNRIEGIYNYVELQNILKINKNQDSNTKLICFLKLFKNSPKSIFKSVMFNFLFATTDRFFDDVYLQSGSSQEKQMIQQLLVKIFQNKEGQDCKIDKQKHLKYQDSNDPLYKTHIQYMFSTSYMDNIYDIIIEINKMNVVRAYQDQNQGQLHQDLRFYTNLITDQLVSQVLKYS